MIKDPENYQSFRYHEIQEIDLSENKETDNDRSETQPSSQPYQMTSKVAHHAPSDRIFLHKYGSTYKL